MVGGLFCFFVTVVSHLNPFGSNVIIGYGKMDEVNWRLQHPSHEATRAARIADGWLPSRTPTQVLVRHARAQLALPCVECWNNLKKASKLCLVAVSYHTWGPQGLPIVNNTSYVHVQVSRSFEGWESTTNWWNSQLTLEFEIRIIVEITYHIINAALPTTNYEKTENMWKGKYHSRETRRNRRRRHV